MKLLLLEDDPVLSNEIKDFFKSKEIVIDTVFDGNLFFKQIKNNQYDIYLLDINVPKINGLDVCKEIRLTNKTTPILMLTAFGEIEDKIEAFQLGADDYLVKPFKFIELVARVKSLLRRSTNGNIAEIEEPEAGQEHIYQFSDLILNDYTKKVTRNGEEISLTSTEYKLLLYFLNNPEKVISRAEILDAVWGVNYELGTNVVDVYVNYLRKKLDSQEDNKLIHTVIGMGYVLKKT